MMIFLMITCFLLKLNEIRAKIRHEHREIRKGIKGKTERLRKNREIRGKTERLGRDREIRERELIREEEVRKNALAKTRISLMKQEVSIANR